VDWAFMEGCRLVSQAHVAASSQGTSIANSLNAKPGTPTQLVASTAFDAVGIAIQVTEQTTATSALLDIMAGASTAESVLIPDMLSSVATGAEAGVAYFFPIFIAQGTRLSARAAMSTAGTIRINAHLLQGSFGASPFSRVTAYGADVSTSKGTTIDPGATANTKPALPATQLVASTGQPIRLMTVACGDNGIFVRTPAANGLLDIYAGAGSSEYALADNIAISFGTSKDQWVPKVPIGNVPIYVPVGTRLSARMQCSGTDATERATDVVVYGVS